LAQHPDTWRSKEQILIDLSKAFRFSADSLEANREGKLAWPQVNHLGGKLVQPAAMAAIFLSAPFFAAVFLTSWSQHSSVSSALATLMANLTHPLEIMSGWLLAVVGVLTAAALALAAYYASRLSPGLYFDILERKVEAREGRVTAREHEVHRGPRGDPAEVYYYDAKELTFPVSRDAFRALDHGGFYRYYFTPRSRVLVAIEPCTPADSQSARAG
jgi:hypothetical protein